MSIYCIKNRHQNSFSIHHVLRRIKYKYVIKSYKLLVLVGDVVLLSEIFCGLFFYIHYSIAIPIGEIIKKQIKPIISFLDVK